MKRGLGAQEELPAMGVALFSRFDLLSIAVDVLMIMRSGLELSGTRVLLC